MAEGQVTSDQERQMDAAWRIYGQLQELVRFADYKLRLLILVSGVMVSVVVLNVNELQEREAVGMWSLGVFLLAFAFFLVFALLELAARKPDDKPEKPGLVYFRDICSHPNPGAYTRAFTAIGAEELLADVCRQNHELARIVAAKFTNTQRAWTCLGLQVMAFTLILWLLAQ